MYFQNTIVLNAIKHKHPNIALRCKHGYLRHRYMNHIRWLHACSSILFDVVDTLNLSGLRREIQNVRTELPPGVHKLDNEDGNTVTESAHWPEMIRYLQVTHEKHVISPNNIRMTFCCMMGMFTLQ